MKAVLAPLTEEETEQSVRRSTQFQSRSAWRYGALVSGDIKYQTQLDGVAHGPSSLSVGQPDPDRVWYSCRYAETHQQRPLSTREWDGRCHVFTGGELLGEECGITTLHLHVGDFHIRWSDRSCWSCYFSGSLGTHGNACTVQLVQFVPKHVDTRYSAMDRSGDGFLYYRSDRCCRWSESGTN
jgi:hypothetical protein